MISKRVAAVAAAIPLALAACGGGSSTSSAGAKACDAKVSATEVTAWFHSGTGAERDVLQAQVDEFNKSNPDKIQVKLELVAEKDYSAAVQSAAASGKLPDVLDFDGPLVYNYAWSGNIVPLDSCVSKDLKDNLLPSIQAQGSYAGKFWSLGQFDAGLGLYASKKALVSVNARIPAGPKDAWTAEEFTKVLTDLKAKGIAQPLDMKVNYGKGEWFTFGFSPAIQSAGGDLINRTANPVKAEGTLDNDKSVKAMTTVQNWFKDGLVNPNTNDDTFAKGQTAVSWVGHWVYNDYRKALGDDLVILPLPKFGDKTVSGQGSWNWGISKNAKDADAAYKFIQFLMTDDQIVKTTDGNGAVPSTKTAIARSANYKPGGPLAIYVDQLSNGFTVARPQTPAYAAITAAFADAVDNIRNGADVKGELTKAAKAIDQKVADNKGYPAPK